MECARSGVIGGQKRFGMVGIIIGLWLIEMEFGGSFTDSLVGTLAYRKGSSKVKRIAGLCLDRGARIMNIPGADQNFRLALKESRTGSRHDIACQSNQTGAPSNSAPQLW